MATLIDHLVRVLFSGDLRTVEAASHALGQVLEVRCPPDNTIPGKRCVNMEFIYSMDTSLDYYSMNRLSWVRVGSVSFTP